jgi:hypothetical protein
MKFSKVSCPTHAWLSLSLIEECLLKSPLHTASTCSTTKEEVRMVLEIADSEADFDIDEEDVCTTQSRNLHIVG